jgi:MoxR-like ATPase
MDDGLELDLRALRDHLGGLVVGRKVELESILAAVAAGRDLLLEGPPGTSKSTILRAITGAWGIPFLMVEGNAELTPARLIGHHNPARVLKEDYSPENFVRGPLTEAMQSGGFLYLEEINRVPEDTLNALLSAMAEREMVIPRVGLIKARPSFRIVAAMNPFDSVGTAKISVSVYDRLTRLAVDYQSEEDERAIVTLRSRSEDRRLVEDAVAVTRATRRHGELRMGSSVRGAIDLVLIGERLLQLRGKSTTKESWSALVRTAARLALSGRIHVEEISDRTPEAVIDGLVDARLGGVSG